MNERVKTDHSYGNLATYSAGFGLSLLLTGFAFWLVHRHVASHHLSPSDNFMLMALAILSIVQLAVQLVFFLHLDRESKPRWNNIVMLFALLTVFILVFGSIWIMTNLDHHHAGYGKTHDGRDLLTPDQTTQYIIKDEGVKP